MVEHDVVLRQQRSHVLVEPGVRTPEVRHQWPAAGELPRNLRPDEQRGVRPCIVVSDPDVIGDQRFPLVCVVPVTGTPGEGLLYPPLAPGRSGLAKPSFALIDQLRSVDKRRVRSVFGELAREEIAAIDEGLAVFLGLADRLEGAGVPPVQ